MSSVISFLKDLLKLIEEDEISGKIGLEVMQHYLINGGKAEDICKEKGLFRAMERPNDMQIKIEQAIAEAINDDNVSCYAEIFNKAMQLLEGKVNPYALNESLEKIWMTKIIENK